LPLCGEFLQDFDPCDQSFSLFIRIEFHRAFVDVPVVADFVPPLVDPSHPIRMTPRGFGRDKKR
jgi:hypothetical protein